MLGLKYTANYQGAEIFRLYALKTSTKMFEPATQQKLQFTFKLEIKMYSKAKI